MPPAFIYFKQFVKHILKGNFLVLGQLRYYRRWVPTLSPERNSVADACPWLTFPAIDFLQKNLKKDWRIFEYGGGGSTLFFLQKAAEVVTVEHNAEWFQLLQKNIQSANWKGHLIPPGKGLVSGRDKSNPQDYYSGTKDFTEASFKAYASFIDQFTHFDVVLVDGRARASCLHHAINKVRNGGYLILDNAERSHYLENNAARINKQYRLVHSEMAAVPYSPSFSRTTIWQRIQ